MNIPPKYEDVLAQLRVAQGREAALREELEAIKRVGPPHFCGLPMSLNPHAEAGKPGRFLEVGAHRECIPCLVSSRHGWAKTAGELQQRLTVAEQRAGEMEIAIINVRETLGREFWDKYGGLDETRDILDAALKPVEEAEALGARPVGCCCPPKGHTGIWAAAMCPVHFGLKRPGVKPAEEGEGS
ncbi:MAG: hypothetical protein J6A65_21125 [Pseudomonas sp.]|nr:hypothetical protein [Pseudomonas sp.]